MKKLTAFALTALVAIASAHAAPPAPPASAPGMMQAPQGGPGMKPQGGPGAPAPGMMQPATPDPATFNIRKEAILKMLTDMEARLPKDRECISAAKNDQDIMACRDKSRPGAAKPSTAPVPTPAKK